MLDITEQTVPLESARLFRVRTVLAVLAPRVQIEFLNPVEIRSGRTRLGWACLYIEKNCQAEQLLFADLVFSYATPERLSIETGSERLYGRPEGYYLVGGDPYDGLGVLDWRILERQDLEQLKVFGIEMGREPAFEGQPRLGEVVL